MLVFREEKSLSFRLLQEAKGQTTVESRKVPRKASAKERATRKCSKANAASVTSAFEVGGELETGCIEMASVDLNDLEIG